MPFSTLPCASLAHSRPPVAALPWLLLAVVCLGADPALPAPTVWTGPRIVFTRAPGGDPAQAADRLTANVWITRGATQGLYNAARETLFQHSSSPADTEWATGTTADYAKLAYRDWETWARSVGNPPATPGVNAVLHLKSEDIYLDIKFLSWSQRSGGFSYERSTPAPSVSPADCLFNWGEANYPTLLPPPRPASQTASPYTYRYYAAANTYLGISSADQHLYYLAASTSSGLLDLGLATTWMKTAGCQ